MRLRIDLSLQLRNPLFDQALLSLSKTPYDLLELRINAVGRSGHRQTERFMVDTQGDGDSADVRDVFAPRGEVSEPLPFSKTVHQSRVAGDRILSHLLRNMFGEPTPNLFRRQSGKKSLSDASRVQRFLVADVGGIADGLGAFKDLQVDDMSPYAFCPI